MERVNKEWRIDLEAARYVRMIAEKYFVNGSTDEIDEVANAMRQHLTTLTMNLPVALTVEEKEAREDTKKAIEALSNIADALAGKK